MDYFPFFFDLRGRRVLIVGGGEVALRKAELLVRAGAALLVVAPEILPRTAAAAANSGGAARARAYQPGDLEGCAAVVSATDDDALNQQVAADARARRVPVNVVDNPALCDFIFPAVIDRAPLIAAVSSCGASPVLARRIRAKIEAMLPPNAGALGRFCARLRDAVKGALPADRRREFWEDALDGPAAEAVLAGDEEAGERLLRESLARFAAGERGVGEVYLIGAGPGAPDLLTFRALRMLQKADVVVYDRLASAAVLDIARRDAEKIFAGKRRGEAALSQEEINALLVEHAQRGKRVARLKGGDPFVFGRGGEEMEALQNAGIPCSVAPGVTAALGCAAEAGIPLTHRGVARGARLCTAYARDMHDAAYWRNLAEDGGTLAFYMAGATLDALAENLVAAGRPASTPTAVVCAGTTSARRVIRGTLGDIAGVSRGRLFSPALVIVGETAAMGADDLQDEGGAAHRHDGPPETPFHEIPAALNPMRQASGAGGKHAVG